MGTRLAYSSFPPITLGALRFILATILLAAIVLSAPHHRRLPARKDLKSMAFAGFLGVTLYFSLENIGIGLTSAANAALIVASYPAITALLEWLIYKVPVSKLKLSGIALAVLGVVVLTHNDKTAGNGNQLIGNIILIATGFVWAFYTFTTRKLSHKYTTITCTFYQTLFGALFFIPLSLIDIDRWSKPSWDSILCLLYLSFFCSVIAFVLYNFGLKKLSSSTSVSLMNLVPVFGVIFSMLVLKESLEMIQLLGGVIIITGVFISVKFSN